MIFNKDRLKSYRFWLSVASAIFILFQAVAKPLGLQLSEEAYMSVVNGVLGIFVVVGLVSDPGKKSENPEGEDTEQEENTEEEKQGD